MAQQGETGREGHLLSLLDGRKELDSRKALIRVVPLDHSLRAPSAYHEYRSGGHVTNEKGCMLSVREELYIERVAQTGAWAERDTCGD